MTKAPAITVNKFKRQAGLPKGISLNNFPAKENAGKPGGWEMPRVAAAVISSLLSPIKILGDSVFSSII